jgi:hypothetical protein
LSSSAQLSSPRIGDVHASWTFPVLIAIAIVTFAGLLYLTRYMNFFYDEWDFVTAYRPQQATSILVPHNEHWVTIPILLWKLLFAVVGLRSHMPYEAAALGAHVACVLLLFALIRRRSGDLPAFAAALILLVLGSGSTNIIWAFQVTWTLSIAFGLLALLLIETSPMVLSPWRVGFVSAALLFALMSSGIGLGFLAAAFVELLVDRRRRRYLLALIVPIAAYGIWFLAYGAALSGTPGAPCPTCSTTFAADLRSLGPGYIGSVLGYISLGLKASASGIVGLGGIAGQIVPALLVVLFAWHWYVQGGIEGWELGLVAGLVAQFALIGVARARLGLQGATDSHYVYVGVVYFLPLVANSIKVLPWRGLWRAAVPSAIAVAILANAIVLLDRASANTELMRTENAELRTVELFRGAPDMALHRALDNVIMPQLNASSYFAAIDELGSPVPASIPGSLSKLPAHAVDQEMVVLFGDAMKVSAADQQSTQGLVCQKVDASNGSIIDVRVPDGHVIAMTSSVAGNGTVSLGLLETPSSRTVQAVQIPVATYVQVRLPNTGTPVLWRLRIVTARVGELQVCGADAVQVQTGGPPLAAGASERGRA